MASISCSIVKYHSEQTDYRCGYCKNPNSNFSHGMWAHTLTVQDYQNLIDRGWRRSGSYCYKPVMDKICCPAYTIRCDALNFKISKSQKKILNRMSNFLKNKLSKEEKMSHTNTDIHHDKLSKIPHATIEDSKICKISKIIAPCEINKNSLPSESSKNSFSIEKKEVKDSIASSSGSKLLADKDVKANKTKLEHNPQKKAKILRLERKQNKLLSQGKSTSEIQTILSESKQQQNSSKTLEQFFSELNSEMNKLELKLIRVMSDEFLKTLDESANLYKKYQMTIHKDDPEDCDKSSFYKFLGKNSLQEWRPENGPLQGYGSFHDQYWLNGKLIAVGVIDILPACVSSVYFYYDPAYSHLSLGTFSSLREIFLTRQLNETVPNLKYYYMGFYIHICPKMRYKSKMVPSKLLCPETYVWCDIEKCLLKLNVNKYSRLNEDLKAIDENGIVNIDEVLLLYREQAMLYKTYRTMLPRCRDEHEISEYAALVGMKCAKSILLYRK
ncbi:arginyl-tRNA--protein transferase 1 [Leptopilina heterotoma]|uniref:arginyl-tRNA--protein transferase 1 n=1 Tax=Leptopilina heterotoma TaxID=63436 RepID=UPI001CA7F182|nr:arginyl-tRNA--protein transferase 1 [Leptopilina heterotoma]